jgi:hypothetical protein
VGYVYICSACREEVDEDDSEVIRLIRWKKVVTMGPTMTWVEGFGEFFHRHHAPPISLEWRLPQA